MSAPYTPPSRAYIPVEEIARIAPNLGYQADFAKPAATSLIEANVWILDLITSSLLKDNSLRGS